MTKVAEIFDSMEYGPAPEDKKPALEWIKAQDGKFVSADKAARVAQEEWVALPALER
ncbi:MAG: hypothetical protein HYU57_07470, partial [Micavibrio aeruginosavorus]|nr:hypothetical protein [Micavibrio aeruginosavorus]